ncbi:adenine phosphoribosyltransferase [Mesoaciditoga lauensis]|uniref:adenine phosphoribosyltransferase n=1 Tax=Mesoaciditoga lauensis TaxID=1495039 RepID=UPI00056CF811|nr:adenine phosphoribosyltransferase [Mesoaciditoga lauensis]
MDIKSYIRDVPDFPTEGVVFKDITPLLKNPQAFNYAIDKMAELTKEFNPNKIVAAEARGFIFGAPISYKLSVGFVPIRKPGKLPYFTVGEEYFLEYAKEKIEMHVDAIDPNDRVVIVDDILATGGTALAMSHLIEKLGGTVVGMVFLGELSFLNPRDKLKEYEIKSVLTY